MKPAAVFLALLGCKEPKSTNTAATTSSGSHREVLDTGSSEEPETDPVLAFQFGILTDCHVTREGDNHDRMRAAVDYLTSFHAETPLTFVAVLGDIAWGDGWPLAFDALSALPMPWVPIQGDNPIQVGEEPLFVETFGAHYDALSATLPGWDRAPVPIDDPTYGQDWLSNIRFEVDGVVFLGLDWNSREIGTLWGETPDLFDLPGGTLPFVEAALAETNQQEGLEDRVIFLTHMPMLYGPGFFDVAEVETLEQRLHPYLPLLGANHAGHLHVSAEGTWESLGLQVTVSDATWDDDNTVRIVQVWKTNRRVILTSEEYVVLSPVHRQNDGAKALTPPTSSAVARPNHHGSAAAKN